MRSMDCWGVGSLGGSQTRRRPGGRVRESSLGVGKVTLPSIGREPVQAVRCHGAAGARLDDPFRTEF